MLFFVSTLLFVFVTQLHLPVYVIESRLRSMIYLGDALLCGFIFGFWLLFVSRFEENFLHNEVNGSGVKMTGE